MIFPVNAKDLFKKVGTMRAFVLQLTLLLALLTVCFTGSALALGVGDDVRAGLSYGSGALPSANLENAVGSGYRFGYYDSQDQFVTLGSTAETQISMLKTQNLYLSTNGSYTTSVTGNGVVGCYHVQLPGSYDSFQAAQSAAAGVDHGFPAWVSGTYYVRAGAYATRAEAEAAQSAYGAGASVTGTSSYGVTVTKTKTTTILFQFDNGEGGIFAVSPGAGGEKGAKTWFKGNKYAGNFLYERIGGGNLTVVNRVSMDDYVKGLVPYEMSSSWPAEALKAQAVCARSFVVSAGTKHGNYHFDVCNTTCCQVYQGCNRATADSDAAVDATSGIYAWYGGEIAKTFYYASNGGATESCQNVWTATLPYLTGKADPYEADIANSVNGYYWTKTFTPSQLTALLRNRGYNCGNIVDLTVSQFTDSGNVYSITFTDDAGKTFVFSKANARSILGVKSMHFTISGGSSSATPPTPSVPEEPTTPGNQYYVDNASTSLPNLDGVWAIGGDGKTETLSVPISVLTLDGVETLQTTVPTTPAAASNPEGTATATAATAAPVTAAAGTFVVSGAGNGHNVGMSQWGAYAMAKRGYSYDQILNFYYTGIDLH